ncbi:MAG: low-complexity protein [Gammaproteobacteria bacterium SHHR-1]|uniref:HvfA family oxazolone/thioamide-modified RiPP metallophore n=1 Tax=Magnetovirga frankeli TaxID=947516 RepID=UPI001292ECA9|nr:low-complexity protein [gamma proteobacterium SS-5]
MKLNKTTLTLALAATLGSAGLAQAAANPFAMQSLSGGYLQTAAGEKGMEAKCGGDKKAAEAKCGGDKKAAEAKCGADKKADKASQGKCGEGKCGGAK